MRIFRSLFLRTSLILLSCVLINGIHAIALDIDWNGSGGPFGDPESWQNVDNWDPAGSPFQVHRVPGDGDTATLSTPSDQIKLFANTAPINGLLINNSSNLRTNGFLLTVDNGGFAGTANTAVGANAQIVIDERPGGTAFVTDNLLLAGGRLLMNSGDAIIEGNTTLLGGSTITNENVTLTRVSQLTFGGDLTLVDSTINLNMSSAQIVNFSAGAAISAREDSVIGIDEVTLGTGTLFELETSSMLTARVLNLGPSSKLHLKTDQFLNGSDAVVSGNVLIDGATLEVDKFSSFELASPFTNDSTNFRAQNDAQVLMNSFLQIDDGDIYHFQTGADLVAPNDLIQVTASQFATNAKLSFTGVGSTLSAGRVQVFNETSSSFNSSLTFVQDAMGTIGDLEVGAKNSTSGSPGIVGVGSGAAIEITNNFELGTQGDEEFRTSILEVETGGSFLQTGLGSTVVGQAAGSAGAIVITNGGVYTSNNQAFDLHPTGRIVVEGGDSSGVVSINGPLLVSGAIKVQHHSFLTDEFGGTLHLNASTIIDGGGVTLSEGLITAGAISFANGGVFHFDGGKLGVSNFNHDLTNEAGVLAPGTTESGSGAGSTAILGDYTQLAGSILEIELGGTTLATEHDFVDVAENASLGGDLELLLIDSFVPDAAGMFTIFNAGNLLGFFDNVSNGVRLSTSDGGGSFVVNYGIGSAFDADQIVLSNFLPASADTEPDGDVDGADFLAIQRTNPALIPLWKSQFGNGATLGASQAVPEPTSLLLAVFAFTAMVTRCSWKATT